MTDSLTWLSFMPVMGVLVGQTVLGAMMIRRMANQVSDLHDWHNVKDADGVFTWYVRRSLEKAILKLADNIERQTEILRDIMHDRKKGS